MARQFGSEERYEPERTGMDPGPVESGAERLPTEPVETERVERRKETGRGEVIYVHSRGGVVPSSIGLQLAGPRVSWGALFAGTVLALVAQLLLSLLGMAVGLGVVAPGTAQGQAAGIGIGAGVWWTVSALISLFLGGWAAGRLSGMTYPSAGVLHGVVTWGIVTLLSVFLLTTAVGGLVGGGAGLIGRGMNFVGQGGAERVAPGSTSGLRAQVEQGARNLQRQAQGITGGDVAQAGQRAADTGWKVSLGAFFALLLGAIAAGIGGKVGAPDVNEPPHQPIRR
jgi:hypothetical protein